MGRFWKAASAVKADLFLPAVPLKILASPKPPCPALYFKDDASRSNYIAKRELASRDPAPRPQGRKFYLHQSIPAGHQPWETKPGADERKDLKLQVQPVRGNVAFVFHLDFENLTKQELGWLCRALKPGEGFLHKLGLGKPLGLGSVEVEPLAIFYVNRKDRYAQQKIFGTQRYHGFQACSSLTEGFVRLLPAKIYGAEMHAVGNCGPTFEELWAAVKPHPDISQALKLLGQPPVGASDQAAPPIQYPATLDMPAEPETDHFQWFVANDDAQHLRERGAWPQQTLAPLTQQSVSLPTLRRLPKKESRQ
jgi:hypothetical protein